MTPFRLLLTKRINPSIEKKAAANGIEVIQREFIKIVPVNTEAKKEEVKRLLAEHATVVFTSKNAVKSLASLAGDALTTGFWEIFCLEGGTLIEVRKHFKEKKISGTASSAKDLAKEIMEKESAKHILFFCGDKRRDDLPEALKQNGFSVNEVVIYKTELSPVAVHEPFDGIAFFSPSAIESFFSMNKLSESIVCFSVGNTTTQALKNYTDNNIITSEEASEEKMIETVGRFNKRIL